MEKPIGSYTVSELRGELPMEEVNGRWRLAKPYQYWTIPTRLRMAWLVFIGKAECLFWE